MSWQRAVTKFDPISFLRTILSTVNIIRQLINVTQIATAAQWAYNAALAVGAALTPLGALALGIGTVMGGGMFLHEMTRYPTIEPYNLGRLMEEEAMQEREEFAASRPK